MADLDETIREIRTTIFALELPPGAQGDLRVLALEVCTEAARSLGFEPEIRLSGPISLVPPQVGSEALVTLREALSNVARHARATRTEITLAASGDGLLLTVIDDGIGPAPSTPQMGRGLANMAERAQGPSEAPSAWSPAPKVAPDSNGECHSPDPPRPRRPGPPTSPRKAATVTVRPTRAPVGRPALGLMVSTKGDEGPPNAASRAVTGPIQRLALSGGRDGGRSGCWAGCS